MKSRIFTPKTPGHKEIKIQDTRYRKKGRCLGAVVALDTF